MPTLYLSPSTQEWNPYVTGTGSEEYWMNQIADRLEPYLLSNGIRYTRNRPEMTAASSIRQANVGYYDFYLALHSNAAGSGAESPVRGIIAFYYPGSPQGQRGAELIAENLRAIYPLPDLVTIQPTTSIGEVSRSRFPASLVEIGYHDNTEDARWIQQNTGNIARQLARALTEFFGIPFVEPMQPRRGRVRLSYGTLNLRAYPSSTGVILANIPNGAEITVYGEWQGWYVVHYQDVIGYAAASYIAV